MRKLDACIGCPRYGSGEGFVPDKIVPDAQVIVYAMEPGVNEVQGLKYLGLDQYGVKQFEPHPAEPLIGATGRLMDAVYLPLAGLSRDDLSLMNAMRCRPVTGQTAPIEKRETQEAIDFCTRAHANRIPATTKLIIAQGAHAMYATTGHAYDFHGWRGYVLPYGKRAQFSKTVWTPQPGEIPVLVTYHLAYTFQEPEASLPAKRDWNKVPQLLAGTWPEAMPEIVTQPPDLWPDYAAFDTEFHREPPHRLVRWSLATRDRRVWVVEARQNAPERVTVTPGSTLIMHNAPVDIPSLPAIVGDAWQTLDIEDTMYAHAVLWTGKVESEDQPGRTGGAMSHKLNFLGSMYGRLNRWKHLDQVNPRMYAGGDALGTMDAWCTGLWGGMLGELTRDPQSLWVYTNLQKPLISIIMKMRQHGIRTDPKAAREVVRRLKHDQAQHLLRAQAYTGWPIKLTSPKQVAWWLRDVEGLRATRRRSYR